MVSLRTDSPPGTGFDRTLAAHGWPALPAVEVSTIQVNVGLVCNQSCRHCHVEAGPHRSEVMSWATMERVLEAARRSNCELLDLTGGAPELNPDFERFVTAARQAALEVQVRTNLKVLTEPRMDHLPEFLHRHQVRLVASLPCYLRQNVDAQRGEGAYDGSIRALQRLNEAGYGVPAGLPLNLVYNPAADALPPCQYDLESSYRRELGQQFGISFTRLLALANVPIGRFEHWLRRQGRKNAYVALLRDSFNPQTLEGLMCRNQVSVGWDGTLYDCDFNLALGRPVEEDAPQHIEDFDAEALASRHVVTGEHCLACTAGQGSSCGGALV